MKKRKLTKELNECICAEWDGKGWSTCGIPCPVHNKMSKKELEKVYKKRKKFFRQFIKDIRSGKVKSKPLDF